jgi:hypothetical protein
MRSLTRLARIAATRRALRQQQFVEALFHGSIATILFTDTFLNSYESLKKSDLEAALDEFIAEHSSRFANRSDLAGYFNSRSKALGSPVKKDSVKDEVEKSLKVAKRKVSKAVEDIAE